MAESKLAKFVEDIIVPPRMIDIIVDGEVLLAPCLFVPHIYSCIVSYSGSKSKKNNNVGRGKFEI